MGHTRFSHLWRFALPLAGVLSRHTHNWVIATINIGVDYTGELIDRCCLNFRRLGCHYDHAQIFDFHVQALVEGHAHVGRRASKL